MKRSKPIGDKLRQLREEAGFTQDQVATGINVKLKTYQAWEYNRCDPPLNSVIALAHFYNITIDELLNNNNPKSASSLEQKYKTAPKNVKNAIISLLEL